MDEIGGIDIAKLLQDNQKKNAPKKGNQKQEEKKSGIVGMANNPMVQMAIKKIPAKYKAMIMLALGFIIIGIGTMVYAVVELVKNYQQHYLAIDIVIAPILLSHLIYSLTVTLKKSAKKGLISFLINFVIEIAFAYWIFFYQKF